MRYLAIETAYDICGVAVVSDKGVEAIDDRPAPRQHNEILAPAVGQLLRGMDTQFKDLDGIALSAGPGSYTGLRVGMSYAKGLAYGTGLPIIPVPSLPSLLQGEKLISPDWVAAWSHGGNLYVMQRVKGSHWGEVQFMSWENFVGLAQADTVAGYQLERFNPEASIDYVRTCPSAVKVGKFALERQIEPEADIAKLIPYYHPEYKTRLTHHARS